MSDPTLIDYTVALGTIVTAFATLVLAGLTYVLAQTTKQANKIASSADIVVTMEPNMWGTMYIDLEVENCGQAIAYDIEITYDPPLIAWEEKGISEAAPFQKIAVLKPNQTLRASLDAFAKYEGTTFTVNISWSHEANNPKRSRKTHTATVDDLKNVTYLGERSALVQIAKHIKKLEEGWRPISRGSQKVKSDIYTKEDRDLKKQADAEFRERVRKKREGKQ